MITGLAVASIASCITLALTISNCIGVQLLVLSSFTCAVGMGLVAPNAAHGSMQPLPAIAGVVAAVLASNQMITAAIASALVSILYDGRSAFAITSVMMGFTITSLLVYLFVVRPAEQSALKKPDS